jgi:hypothetical protein
MLRLPRISLRGVPGIAQDVIGRYVQDAIETGTGMLGCNRMSLRSTGMLGLFTISVRGELKLSRINERYTKMV